MANPPDFCRVTTVVAQVFLFRRCGLRSERLVPEESA
jgi:hypothetical protein